MQWFCVADKQWILYSSNILNKILQKLKYQTLAGLFKAGLR